MPVSMWYILFEILFCYLIVIIDVLLPLPCFVLILYTRVFMKCIFTITTLAEMTEYKIPYIITVPKIRKSIYRSVQITFDLYF